MRISRYKKWKKPEEIRFKANRNIKAPELRVIDETGKHLGVLPFEEALKLAEERGYDLVEVSPKDQPPIAKFLDYGKFKYIKEKEARVQKAHSKTVEVKGIRLSIRISEHDLNTRKEQARRFLERGDKLQIEIVLRGRERQHIDLAKKIMLQFVDAMKQEMAITVEQPFSKEGGRLTMTIARV